MPDVPLVPLVRVKDSFAARVLVARLGSEGIVTSLRGAVDGPYPVGDVAVFVDADDMDLARQLLLADEVEETFTAAARDGATSRRIAGMTSWLAVAAVVFVAVASSLARVLTL